MRYVLAFFFLLASAHAQTLTVFAASSLTDAFNELAKTFEAQHEGVTLTLSFGSSSTLATQIAEGATADVFASADTKNIAKIVPENEVSVFTKNKLVVISSNPDLTTLESLAGGDYLLVLADESVPVGKYAREVLENLNSLYGNDYSDKVLIHLASNETNVRQVLSKVELGEADVGIVYVTDAQDSELTNVDIPAEFNVVADYGIAVVPESSQNELAQQFVDFVLSAEGQAVLQTYGFLPK
jgi:molybdate transport system substrate-binding protein